MLLLFGVLLLGILHGVLGVVVLRSLEELSNRENDYDFIVVGGGTAGGVIGARLGENSKFKILIIEAGPSNEDVFQTHPPGLASDFNAPNPFDWNLTLVPQAGLYERRPTYARGKMLGGCSSHNSMYYTRGSKDDWNSWSGIVGAQQLSWDEMLPFILGAEALTNDSENQSETGHFDPFIHNRTGKVATSAPYSVHPFNDMLIETTKELSHEFPFKLDMNDGSPIGVAWNQFTVDHRAERSSSATAYIAKAGSNVHVLVNTYVTRVLPVEKDEVEFRTVEFGLDATSPKRCLSAKKEVIISAGVIQTPQILLNSGIGSKDELQAVGIPTIVDNPSVGKNFSDQVGSLILMETTIQDTDFDREAALAQWNQTRTGPLAIPNRLNHLIFVRLPDDGPLFNQAEFLDVTAGKDSPHLEIMILQISSQQLPPTLLESGTVSKKIALLVINLHPVSRGSISLNTSNPFSSPLIDPGLLSHDFDIAILREGVRSAQRLLSAPVFKDSVFQSVSPPANQTSDEDLDAYLRSAAIPILHGVGSATMSPQNASWGVVDPDFRVKGTRGLRVVDASVIPMVPSGHTQVPVYGIAELASVQIIGKWL